MIGWVDAMPVNPADRDRFHAAAQGSGKTVLAQAKHEICNPLILRRPGGGEFVEILLQHLVQLCAGWAYPFHKRHARPSIRFGRIRDAANLASPAAEKRTTSSGGGECDSTLGQ